MELAFADGSFDVIWTLRVHPGAGAESLLRAADHNGDGVLSHRDRAALKEGMEARLRAERPVLELGGAPLGQPTSVSRELDVGHSITLVLRATHPRPAGPTPITLTRAPASPARLCVVSVSEPRLDSSAATGDATTLAHTADRTWSGSLGAASASLSFVVPAAGSLLGTEDRK